MLLRVEDGARVTTFGYDLLGNAVRETDIMKVSDLDAFTMAKHTFTTRREYDTWGRELQMTYPDGEVLTTGYDSGGLARTLRGTKNGTTNTYVKRAEYDRFGHQRFTEYGNGVTTLTSYDDETQWFADQLVKQGSQVISDLHYQYDAAGNVLQRNDTRPVPPSSQLGGPSSQTFTYDDLNRLTSASGTYRDSYRRTRTYTLEQAYDAAGRMLHKKQTDKVNTQLQGATTFDLTYRYDGTQPHAPSRVGNRVNTWDADGNLLSWRDDSLGSRRTMTWDEEDRIKTASDGESITRYKYDDENNLSITEGPTPLGETELVNDRFSVVEGVSWKTYFLNDARVATTRIFSAPDVPMYYFNNDLTGSTYLVTDRSKVLEHSLVLPTGQPWVEEGLSSLKRARFAFAGGYYDDPKDLYNLGDRWYDPRDGFLYSTDPVLVGDLEETVSEPMLLDAYTYAANNPTSYVDPTGNQWVAAQASTQVPALAPQTPAPSTTYLGAHRTYNTAEAKTLRDRFRSRAEVAKMGKKLHKGLGLLGQPTLIEVEIGFNTDMSFDEVSVSILGIDKDMITSIAGWTKKKFRTRKSP
jgi:RHS repeat-associated protein